MNYIAPNPIPSPNEFNYNYFTDEKGNLTLEQADKRYLKLSGGSVGFLNVLTNLNVIGDYYKDSVLVDLSSITGVINGIAQADKAVILDSNKDITGLNNVTLSNGNAHLTISAPSGGLDLTGNNTKLQITGANSHLILTHNEASTSSTTGVIQSAGGFYMGGNSLIENSTLTLKNVNDSIIINNTSSTGRANVKYVSDLYSLEIGLRGSTASNPNTCYWYFNGGYKMLMNINGDLSLLSTTEATAYNSASLMLSGSLGVAKKCYFNSNTFINSSLQITNSNAPTSGTGLEMNYNTTASTANIYSYDRTNLLYKTLNLNDFLTIYKQNNAVSINTTDTFSTLNIGGSSYTMLGFKHSTTSKTLIGGATDGTLAWTIEHSLGTCQCIFNYKGHLSLTTTSLPPRYCIDLQTSANDIQICLYQQAVGTNDVFGIGAANSAIEMHSSAHFFWYKGTTGNGALGTKMMTLNSNGCLDAKLNIIARAGLHANGFDNTDLSAYGSSAHLVYYSGQNCAWIYGFDYSSGTSKDLALGVQRNIWVRESNSYFGVGTSTPSFPIDIQQSATTSTIFGFGYLASSGSGTATGFTNRPFSLRCLSGIQCQSGEINVMSDKREKKEIENLDEKLADSFLDINPVSFKYKKHDDRIHYGYIAQDIILKNKQFINTLVGFTTITDDEEELERDEIIGLDEKTKLLLSHNDIIPLLHLIIKKHDKKIKENREWITDNQFYIDELNQYKETIHEQETEILNLKETIKILSESIKINTEMINDLQDYIEEKFES